LRKLAATVFVVVLVPIHNDRTVGRESRGTTDASNIGRGDTEDDPIRKLGDGERTTSGGVVHKLEELRDDKSVDLHGVLCFLPFRKREGNSCEFVVKGRLNTQTLTAPEILRWSRASKF
jgi:hypothetical protein